MDPRTFVIFIAVPVGVPILTASLRRKQRATYWGVCGAFLVAIAIATPFLFVDESNPAIALVAVFLAIPVCATFAFERLSFLQQHPVIAYILGPVCYVTSLWLALSLSVVTGLLIP